MKRFALFCLCLLVASAGWGATALSFCVVNGDTMGTVAGADVTVRVSGGIIAQGYTDAGGCFETDYVEVGEEVNLVEVDVLSKFYFPSYTYPRWECELAYPVSPPYVMCDTTIKLVPRYVYEPPLNMKHKRSE